MNGLYKEADNLIAACAVILHVDGADWIATLTQIFCLFVCLFPEAVLFYPLIYRAKRSVSHWYFPAFLMALTVHLDTALLLVGLGGFSYCSTVIRMHQKKSGWKGKHGHSKRNYSDRCFVHVHPNEWFCLMTLSHLVFKSQCNSDSFSLKTR